VTAKFIIVNNGLKDQLGHYFETSVSVAEAARALGLKPILATHATCSLDFIPDWLDAYPLFCADHWMSDPPPPAPPIRGMRADPYAQCNLTIDQVRAGKVTVEEYLKAHIEFPSDAATPSASLVDLALRHPVEAPVVQAAAQALRQAGFDAELGYALLFKRDLERLLSLTTFEPTDHVFLPTAHGRDLLAAAMIIRRLGEDRAPTFHLEFRHSTFMSDPQDRSAPEPWYLRLHRAYFSAYAQTAATSKIEFYTDSEELSDEYKAIAGWDFDVLPIPFRYDPAVVKKRVPGQPLCFSYLGEARDEKGFHWLADVIDALMKDYILPGKLCFQIQATLKHPVQYHPQSFDAIARLLKCDPRHVALVGLAGALSPQQYSKALANADVVLCPYHAYRYKSASSGTLMEAIVAGKPTIVPPSGWLARQQPPATGECCWDVPSLVRAIQLICDNFDSYHEQADAYRNLYRFNHSPDRLVRNMLAHRLGAERCGARQCTAA
jgi:glycosyltransferase involved in cell wall biosynthesis